MGVNRIGTVQTMDNTQTHYLIEETCNGSYYYHRSPLFNYTLEEAKDTVARLRKGNLGSIGYQFKLSQITQTLIDF